METPFIAHMKSKYPELDVITIMDMIDRIASEIQINPTNPDPSIRISPASDLNKNLIVKVISEYLKSKS